MLGIQLDLRPAREEAEDEPADDEHDRIRCFQALGGSAASATTRIMSSRTMMFNAVNSHRLNYRLASQR